MPDEFVVLRCDSCKKLRCSNSWLTQKYMGRCGKCFCGKAWGVNLEALPRAKKALVLYWYLRHTIHINSDWSWWKHPIEIIVNLWRFSQRSLRKVST